MSTAKSVTARVHEAWGDPPAWVVTLAQECDRSSQAKVADRIGYSAAVVSQVLKGTYTGDLGRVEAAVRGAFLSATVACPGQGREIPTNECLSWQRRGYDGTNHLAVTMYRACRSGCPNTRQGGGNAE